MLESPQQNETSPKTQARIRDSFARQGLMRHLGAQITHVAEGRVHITCRMPALVRRAHIGGRHRSADSVERPLRSTDLRLRDRWSLLITIITVRHHRMCDRAENRAVPYNSRRKPDCAAAGCLRRWEPSPPTIRWFPGRRHCVRGSLFTTAFGEGVQCRRTADHHHPAADATDECHLRTRHRNPPPRTPGPDLDPRRTPSGPGARRVPGPLQRFPTAPIPTTTATGP